VSAKRGRATSVFTPAFVERELVADPTKLLPGAVFARDFKIVKPLREGGMGAVYIAEQLSTGRQRALKLMAPSLVDNPEVRERFVREAKVAANIDSDHVVETVTAGVDEATGAPYLVMELLRGEELADAAVRAGPLTVADLREVFSQVGHALEQAHAQGVVHRDLKPENIFLAASRRRDVPFTAKILDFGIAKLVADGLQKTGTQPLGSPLFMSPEQTDRKGRICPATDVWALGLIAFYLLTGQYFWKSAIDGSLPSLLREICVEPIPLATARAAELGAEGRLPVGFDAWFARCVDRDIDKRFVDGGECVRALVELVGDAPADRKLSMISTANLGTGDVGPSVDAHGATAIVDETGKIGASERAQTLHKQATNAGAELTVIKAAPASKLPLYAGVAVAVAALGAGAMFVSRGGDAPTAQAGSGAAASAPAQVVSGAAASASGALASSASASEGRCPAGMVYHPTGGTYMGSKSLPAYSGANINGRMVRLSSFCLDATEVTVKAYEACVTKGICERAADTVEYTGVDDAKKKLYSPFCNARKKDRDDHPINCVSHAMAVTYCKDRGARLPTEAEWEYAARGPAQHDNPWGNEPPDTTRLNAAGAEFTKWSADNGKTGESTMYTGDDGWVGTAPVGTFPAGKSGYGVLDLAGNVWEWTADWYAPYVAGELVDPTGPATGEEKTIRGGAFNGSDPQWAHPAWRYRKPPSEFSHVIGFRCAVDAKGEPRLGK
jgi:formylglycine-generating enzyme required for sulfatase activity/serine/threonine protein kinase